MSTLRKTLFISDLHLEVNCPKITHTFLSFLRDSGSSIDAIYILGDLFEAWIGDDDHSPYHQQIIQALQSVTQKGLSIYLIHGNRDFLLGKKFFNATGCKLLPDEQVINLYQTNVLLMHGDILCTRDTTYLKLRKKVRNKWIQKLFLLLPLFVRRKIVKKMRETSIRYMQSATPEIMDVTQVEVERIMQKHNVQCLIHGHTHRPGMHSFILNHHTATRMVLGAWHDKGNALVWDETGKKEWMDF